MTPLEKLLYLLVLMIGPGWVGYWLGYWRGAVDEAKWRGAVDEAKERDRRG